MNYGIFKSVVEGSLCMSCGVCEGLAPQAFRMRFDVRKGMFFPEQIRDVDDELKSQLLDICPGLGYPILALSRLLHGEPCSSSIELGRWKNLWAMQCKDAEILANATSGGVMTALGAYLLDTEQVDGIVVTDLDYSCDIPQPYGFIATTREDLIRSQGSKYCPSPTMKIIAKMVARGGRYAVMGTPCQIAGLLEACRYNDRLRETVKLTVSNFCGGFRDFRETLRLIEMNGINAGKVTFLKYRGSGQPGRMMITEGTGRTVSLPYPQYAKLTGIMKHYRCRSCVDATGELADISCGDAWVKRYLDRKSGWSIVISRNAKAQAVLSDMMAKGRLAAEELDEQDVLLSQETNLKSKKHRQMTRRVIFKIFGIGLPTYDGGYHERILSGYLPELKIHLSTAFFHFAELAGFYPALSKILKRKA